MSRGIDQAILEAIEETNTVEKLMQDDDLEEDAILSDNGDGNYEELSDYEIDSMLKELEDE